MSKRKSKPRKWTPEADELMYGLWGMHTSSAITKRINTILGTTFTHSAVINRAVTLGLSVDDAQGYPTIAQVARDLGINKSALASFIRRRGLKTLGRGSRAYLPETTVEAARTYYRRPDEPSMSLPEVATILSYSYQTIYRMVREERLKSIRCADRWWVPAVEVQRVRMEQIRKAKGVA